MRVLPLLPDIASVDCGFSLLSMKVLGEALPGRVGGCGGRGREREREEREREREQMVHNGPSTWEVTEVI